MVSLFHVPLLGKGTEIPPPPIGMPEICHRQGQPLDLLTPLPHWQGAGDQRSVNAKGPWEVSNELRAGMRIPDSQEG